MNKATNHALEVRTKHLFLFLFFSLTDLIFFKKKQLLPSIWQRVMFFLIVSSHALSRLTVSRQSSLPSVTIFYLTKSDKQGISKRFLGCFHRLDKSVGEHTLGPDQTVSGKVHSTVHHATQKAKAVDERKGYLKTIHDVKASLF